MSTVDAPSGFVPRVRIHRPAKSAMQSGRAGTHGWVLEFASDAPHHHDPLTGWVSGHDTRTQVRLRFATEEAAVAFAERHGYAYEVEPTHDRTVTPKAYADNFRFDAME